MNTEAAQLLAQILKKNNLSVTRARRRVCECLWGSEPLTMAELISRVHPDVDRASVYRTVALFEQLGLVQRVYLGWKYKVELSDVLSHHHHHISCMDCGRVVALSHEEQIERLIDEIAKQQGFTAQQHQLEVRGYCASCSKKHAATSNRSEVY